MAEHDVGIESVKGVVHTGSGDIFVKNFDLGYQGLKESLPKDDPNLQRLVESIKGFAVYHERIDEWKQLHNLLQDLHNSIGPFSNKVEELYYDSKSVKEKDLSSLWKPCQNKIQELIGFAERIKYISSTPYYVKNGNLYGPEWMVEIVSLERNIDVTLRVLKNTTSCVHQVWVRDERG